MKNTFNNWAGPIRALIPAFLLLASLNGYSQEPLAVTKITGGITFDGSSDEEAWNRSAPFKMTMQQPVFGNEPTETSVIRMVYDNDYFYLSAVFNYSDITQLRAISKKRDKD